MSDGIVGNIYSPFKTRRQRVADKEDRMASKARKGGNANAERARRLREREAATTGRTPGVPGNKREEDNKGADYRRKPNPVPQSPTTHRDDIKG